MGLFDKAERAVEKSVNSVFSKMSHAPLKSVDLAAELKRSMDEAMPVEGTPDVHYNFFTVALSPQDFESLTKDSSISQLSESLADELYFYAEEQQFYLLGDISVTVVSSESTGAGRIMVTPQIHHTATAPAFNYAATAAHPIIELDGRLYRLNQPVIVMGRGTQADIRLNDNGVSREHLELKNTDQGMIATDLNSTNGTFVEDQRVTLVRLVDENLVRIGNTTFTFFTGDEGGI
ncbi:FhaA domain-containing protein [Boudabousia marimammalium]|uniref:FHA domain-containing protein n=1 Tax=Boudabousia marimammalium TaxID=156892 RepID=A0A1Q5PSM9_9ACTO|nr:FhaA domain-containing protein [Boudabousia marimammalium]OKL50543.1 hypothetical protein BM477_00815 [Boudabousia marimammalium]